MARIAIIGAGGRIVGLVSERLLADTVRRPVFISMIGVHDEVPGEFGRWNASMIGPYLAAAKLSAKRIEASGLEYTILRARHGSAMRTRSTTRPAARVLAIVSAVVLKPIQRAH